MEATRIQISQATKKIAKIPLTRREKIALKREKIVNFIKSWPVDKPIRIEQLGSAANIKRGSSQIFVKKMLEDGIIEREQISPRSFLYSVRQNGPVVVTTPKLIQLTMPDIEQSAMEFAWEHTDDGNDLRSFISWLKQKMANN